MYHVRGVSGGGMNRHIVAVRPLTRARIETPSATEPSPLAMAHYHGKTHDPRMPRDPDRCLERDRP
jgi:hypothetical protein